jgi:hypothetical protein
LDVPTTAVHKPELSLGKHTTSLRIRLDILLNNKAQPIRTPVQAFVGCAFIITGYSIAYFVQWFAKYLFFFSKAIHQTIVTSFSNSKNIIGRSPNDVK